MKERILKLSTGVADGAASTLDTMAILGKLYAIEYQPGDIATGATLTVTSQGSNLAASVAAKPLLTLANAGTAIVWLYPRDLEHKVSDGVALTGEAGGDRTCPIIQGVIKATIASGGNSKVGYVVIYYE
jgi:hypothetical protein